MPADAHLPKPWRHPAFQEMRIRIETLQEENRQLREALAPVFSFPVRWRLGLIETGILSAVVGSPGVASWDRIRRACRRPDCGPSDKHLHVALWHLRRKLRPHGIEIVTQRRRGLALSPESRALIDTAMSTPIAGQVPSQWKEGGACG